MAAVTEWNDGGKLRHKMIKFFAGLLGFLLTWLVLTIGAGFVLLHLLAIPGY